jgi:hypothetical protein
MFVVPTVTLWRVLLLTLYRPAATKQHPSNMSTTAKSSFLFSCLLLVVAVSSFQSSHNTCNNNFVRPTSASVCIRRTPAHTQLNEKGGRPEFEVGDEEYSGDIDWDGEWAKVVKESGKTDRPGKDFYKSDAERATIKAVNKAAEQVAKVKVQTPSFKPPPIRSLQGDWRVSSVATMSATGAKLTYDAHIHLSNQQPTQLIYFLFFRSSHAYLPQFFPLIVLDRSPCNY